jgi:hypothetical protein
MSSQQEDEKQGEITGEKIEKNSKSTLYSSASST